MKVFLNHFLVAIGAFASVMTMISFFFDIKWNVYPNITWVVIVVILLVCIAYAYAQTLRKKKIKIRIAENFQLTIQEGNLFQQKGVIVIPVNDYFDTHVGDGIIEPTSVHGQFIINLFSDRVKELDEKIMGSLKLQGICGEEVPARQNGKNVKYPLGTCVDVMDGGNKYIWVVTTEFDKNNIARLSRDKLARVLDGLFSHIELVCGKDKVCMPVIGAGNARLNRSPERILHYIIDYCDFSLSEKKILGGVEVVVLSAKEINLGRIERIFENSRS